MSTDHLEGTIVGESRCIRELRALIRTVARSNLRILIEGPTGSGKELVARALHEESTRKGAFVAFNVGALTAPLFEDALFGHVRGAFTGAHDQVPGYLLEAHGGTLFMDEIGTLSPGLQTKLLRVLETGSFRPVGARSDRSSSFRVVAATNERLEERVREGVMRADLYHRLAGLVIQMPALRDRVEDIPLLVRHFLSALGPQGERIQVTAGAMRVLQHHSWPGNVRELRNVLDVAVVLMPNGTLGAQEVKSALPRRFGHGSNGKGSQGDRDALLMTLEDCGWDTDEAASRLDVHRATVYRRMGRLGIVRPRDGDWG
jgi:sigma-54 dependent transcriptional regulator, flagellar regulatory protein